MKRRCLHAQDTLPNGCEAICPVVSAQWSHVLYRKRGEWHICWGCVPVGFSGAARARASVPLPLPP
eukprot:6179029-Pleurochrysis_carterae.AAC.2